MQFNRKIHYIMNNICRVPVYLPYLQPMLTQNLIQEAETKIGHKLPSEYLYLLEKQNGGYIRYSLKEITHNLIKGIGPNFPGLTDFDWEDDQDFVSFQLNGLIPFDGDGHWHLCFDYRKLSDNPEITYIDIECNKERKIASSFSDYLGLLELDTTNLYVIEDIIDITSSLNKLAKALSYILDPPDYWISGYPIYRLRSTIGSDFAWISPNDVSYGFIRNDDPKYEILKNSLNGIKKRYLNLPDNAYLLETSEVNRLKIFEVFNFLKIKIRPLKDYSP